MSKNISCAVVKDLLPNYIDKLTSEETNKIMEDHFDTCVSCTMERDAMRSELAMDKIPEDVELKKYLNKTKKMYLLKGVILSIGIIGIIVSFIVDLAVNRSLTWSLIVDMSMVYLYASGFVAIVSMKNKIIKTLIVMSVLLLPLLYGMEYVINTNYLSKPEEWFKVYALPITVAWLIILWVIILIKKFTKLNIWNVVGILLLLSIFGSVFTDSIAEQVPLTEVYYITLDWIDSIVYFGCAIICFVIGYIRKDKCRI